ncbi:TPA: Flp pilus assembly complex ATPase component TadA [Candidatus Galligastranaerophilus intestinavium]|uniref:Flp pilus assembly complex ATPase component TadA n=1 Tax=Candidatus Galligastranaerophilus intestinavium TaxID=2840836 RepID=A0A9D1JX73_9BACT|nr:Flp pilus assembly complex ATPase component TadA [Candidatus Galligastranaerophilus intestinavium]
MTNDLLDKLIKKINFEHANNFELAVAKEYSFVPINVQGDSFFVAVSPDADKEKIIEYVKPIVDKKIEFIFLSKQNFDTLFDAFLKKFSSRFGSVLSGEFENDPFASVEFEGRKEFNNINKDSQADSVDDDNVVDIDIDDETELDDDELDLSADDTDEEELNVDDNALELSDSDESSPINDKSQDKKSEKPEEKVRGNINAVDSPTTKKIGEILIEEGLINNKQLTMALAEAKVLGIPLGSVLVKMGFITIKELKEALGAQMGVKLATAEQLKALPTAISILPEDFVRENKVIPLSMTDKSLVVGMVDPGNSKTINEIVYQTGLKPTVIMVTHYEYEAFLQTYYENEREAANKMLREIESERVETSNDDSLWDQVENEIQDTSGNVAKFANKIVTLAIDQHASDIHIEPRLVGYVVRFRIDGTLREVLKIPAKVDSAVVSRFKVLARMNIAEHRRAQDGNFSIKYKRNQHDFRVNTLPVGNKEKMVIRILAPAITDTNNDKEIKIDGISPDDKKKIEYLISLPNGIVLTSGPTGSGKTTTLYSLIRTLNSEDVNITTIEDPIEIKMDGVNQSAVNPKAGITFANCLRAILRQDPDIILVGEIRDFETLEVAISASLTGHLVLSTIHTNSAAATITRLIEMGAKDYLISSTVTGVLAQRLVKKLCPECKEAYKPTLEEARKILTDPQDIKRLTEATIYKARGCPYCNNTGYYGRTGVFEIMLINKEMKKMIAQRAHDVELEDYAIKHGMKTLKMSCLEHILNGVTTIDEFVRILGLASEQ